MNADDFRTPGYTLSASFELEPADAPPIGGTPVAGKVETVTEYGQLMSGGGVHVRNPDPEIERIYPLAQWIPHHRRFGGTVLRRRVIVVEDWVEVTEP